MHPDLEPAILTCAAMGRADAFAMVHGVSGERLMDAAGQGLADAVMSRWAPRLTAVLCGPGNNGGDGWVAARHLQAAGWPVEVFSLVEPASLKGDAAAAATGWTGDVKPLDGCDPSRFGLVIDALFGAGLARPLTGEPARLARDCAASDAVMVAADVPSGVHGDRAVPLGEAAFTADLTVTFHRRKPAHVLHPAAGRCGELVLVDIGIPQGWAAEAEPCAVLNDPDLWAAPGLALAASAHKHSRGRLCVMSGPRGASGAARLAARAGLIGGAGFVTVLCGQGALNEIASAEAGLVARAYDREADFAAVLAAHRASAAVLGPGGGLGSGMRSRVISACQAGGPLVLDADALSVFADDPDTLFEHLHASCVLTPHAGEFARLFPDLADALQAGRANKIELTRQAAARAGAVIVFKGPDTVIADPAGRVRVNIHAGPRLATAGTGDVLAGLIGAYLAQGQGAFDAASAAVWIHGDAGLRLGPGSSVNEVLAVLPHTMAALRDRQQRKAALRRIRRTRL